MELCPRTTPYTAKKTTASLVIHSTSPRKIIDIDAYYSDLAVNKELNNGDYQKIVPHPVPESKPTVPVETIDLTQMGDPWEVCTFFRCLLTNQTNRIVCYKMCIKYT